MVHFSQNTSDLVYAPSLPLPHALFLLFSDNEVRAFVLAHFSLQVFRNIFAQVVQRDLIFSSLLRRIKAAYESAIQESRAPASSSPPLSSSLVICIMLDFSFRSDMHFIRFSLHPFCSVSDLFFL